MLLDCPSMHCGFCGPERVPEACLAASHPVLTIGSTFVYHVLVGDISTVDHFTISSKVYCLLAPRLLNERRSGYLLQRWSARLASDNSESPLLDTWVGELSQ